MMTISDVPTNTPIPIVEISRNVVGERETIRGSDPARKDLNCQIISTTILLLALSHRARRAYAIPITALRVSSMKSPANMIAMSASKVPRCGGASVGVVERLWNERPWRWHEIGIYMTMSFIEMLTIRASIAQFTA
jgi:hypothetical protein